MTQYATIDMKGKGFSLVEAMVALFIFCIGLLAIVENEQKLILVSIEAHKALAAKVREIATHEKKSIPKRSLSS